MILADPPKPSALTGEEGPTLLNRMMRQRVQKHHKPQTRLLLKIRNLEIQRKRHRHHLRQRALKLGRKNRQNQQHLSLEKA